MSEREERAARPGRQPAEGVRILRPEEAQAALEAGEAAGRRPDDQLRFGDVPPAPSGPRPAHRFPLPDSVDPARAVELPPLAVPGRSGRDAPAAAAGRGADPEPELHEAYQAQESYEAQGGYGAEEDYGAEEGYEPHEIYEPADAYEPPETYERVEAPTTVEAADPGRPTFRGVQPARPSSEQLRWRPPPARQAGEPEPWSAPPVGDPTRAYEPEPPVPPPAPAPRGGSAGAPVRSRRGAAGSPGGQSLAPEAGTGGAGGWEPGPDWTRPEWETDPDSTAEMARPFAGHPGPAQPDRGHPGPAQPDPGRSDGDPLGGARPREERPTPGLAATGTPDMGSAGPEPASPHAVPEEGITVTGSNPEMPHWSDPPTGEVPRLRLGDEAEDDDDMEAWRSLGSRGVRWRDEDDWDDADELDDLVEDVEPTGALDMNRAEHSDLYSFDEDFERVTSRTGSHPAVDADDDFADESFDDLEDAAYARSSRGHRAKTRRGLLGRGRGRGRGAPSPGPGTPASPPRSPAAPAVPVASAPDVTGPLGGPAAAAPAASAAARTATGARPRPERPQRPPAGRPAARSATNRGDDVGSRVAVGVALIVLLAIAYAVGAKALLALAALIIVAAAAEAYQMMRTAGFRPATLLGLVGTVGMVVAAYEKGIQALPVVTVLLIVGAMLWYVLGIVEARPLANAAVTVLVFGWVGILGAFSGVLLALGNGKGLFLGAIATAVAADVCAFAVGRLIGSRPMAPHISPHKTWEGYAGGVVGALIVGAIIGKSVTPWGGMRHGLVLGLIVGLVCPAGDLFESMIKRDLGIKDSGSILGGHGGLLDRFDVILLALPAAYFVATFFHL